MVHSKAWASIGLHPHESTTGVDEVGALLAREMSVDDDVVVAVGRSVELDYYYEHSLRFPRSMYRVCAGQDRISAHAHDLELVIHARDACDDVFDVLAVEGVPERTILHCFTGGPEELDRCVRTGLFVSFSGIITFKNASDIRDAAAGACPLDRLLVETDSPFLAPVNPIAAVRTSPRYCNRWSEKYRGGGEGMCSGGDQRESTAATAAAVAFAIQT